MNQTKICKRCGKEFKLKEYFAGDQSLCEQCRIDVHGIGGLP